MQAVSLASTGNVSTKNGELVRMRLPPNGKKGEIAEISLTAVAHEMARGAHIINDDGFVIMSLQIPIRRKLGSKIEYNVPVIDPGPGYRVCFDPAAPPHLAMYQKA